MFFTRTSINRNLVLRSLMLLCLLLPVGASAGQRHPTALVVFGDSLSDNGNLFRVTGGAIPPSPPYFKGRFSNGPVWAEYVAAELGVPLVDFAFGGALTSRLNEFDSLADLPGLTDEIDAFAAMNPSGADPNAVYVVWAGANDFFAAPSAATISGAITNLLIAVGTLDVLGARHIVVANMPDLGITPDGLASGFSAELTALSAAFNAALAKALDVSGVDVAQVDIFKLLHKIVAEPSDFGFTDVTTPCLTLEPFSLCRHRDEHLFWDSVHPTTRGHAILARTFGKVIEKALRKDAHAHR
jgi:outer membrane lipase/esterase